MDNRRGLLGGQDQMPNYGGNAQSLSPYFDFNPAYISPDSHGDFILPEGQSARRGRFEMAFSQIGGSVIAGGFVGGLNGLYIGVRDTGTANLIGTVRRTQIINYVTKQGASYAQTLGVVALLYGSFGVLVSKTRGVDDELNTIASGTLTGLLYKSTGGLKQCARGGLVGLGLATAYVLTVKRNEVKAMLGMN